MVRPTGLGGVSDFFFNGPPNGPGRGFGMFSMDRPTGLRGRGRFFQWFAQRARGDSDFFNGPPNAPGGVSFFNGPPNGPGRGFVFQWPNGPGRGFVFQWFAQRVWRGFGFFLLHVFLLVFVLLDVA